MTEAESGMLNAVDEIVHWLQYPMAVQQTHAQLHLTLKNAKARWMQEIATREINKIKEDKNGSNA